MENTFKTGDKVLTKVKGQQVEAVVHQVYNLEVQVRTADKKLLWRTVKTVTLVTAAAPEVAQAEGPQTTDAETPTPSENAPVKVEGDGVMPPPLPDVKPTEPPVETPQSGPALVPASNSVKYKRTRSFWKKPGKI